MSQYRCTRTFTSQTTWKKFSIGQIITQMEYDFLSTVEKQNFIIDMDFDTTSSPVFEKPIYDNSTGFVHERNIS